MNYYLGVSSLLVAGLLTGCRLCTKKVSSDKDKNVFPASSHQALMDESMFTARVTNQVTVGVRILIMYYLLLIW